MDIIDEARAVARTLQTGWYGGTVTDVSMLRLDLIHPVISGNKWYKLKQNLWRAREEGYPGILTFGGPYSNHLVAAAAAAKMFGLTSAGIVRGSEFTDSPTLRECRSYGMQLVFVTRDVYREKDNADFIRHIPDRFARFYLIPEGGANKEGIEGAGEIARLIPARFTHVCIPVGTGTGFAGIRKKLAEDVTMIGFVPMKNGVYLQNSIQHYIDDEKLTNWYLRDDWHFGGFGKHPATLIRFMNEFFFANKVPLDIVYTAKMMFGMKSLLQSGFFPSSAHVLCIHTGGLQGNRSVAGQLEYPPP